jgi:hypothetical protein
MKTQELAVGNQTNINVVMTDEAIGLEEVIAIGYGAWINSGQDPNKAPWSQEQVDLFYAGTDPDYPNSNWVDYIVRPYAPMKQHNLSVRGGSDKIKYYGFLGYLDQETLIRTGGGITKGSISGRILMQP